MGVLRLALAFSVVAAHLLPNCITEWGDHAVSLFFILSGFYMTLVLNEKYPSGRHGYYLFAKARILRLFPTYLLVLGLSVFTSVIGARLMYDTSPHNGANIFAELRQLNLGPALFLAATNIFVFGQDVLLFLKIDGGALRFTSNFWAEKAPAYHYLLVPQAWSLSLELMFYALAPFIVRRSAVWIAGLASVSFALKIFFAVALNLPNDPWSYRFFPTTLFYFLLGALACKAMFILRRAPGLPRGSSLVPLAAISTILLWGFMYYALGQFAWPLQVVLVAVSLPVAFLLWGRNRADRWIGELTYPIYISHMFVINFLAVFSINSKPFVFVSVLVFSMALVFLVENPLEKFRQRVLAKNRM
jgi:peptidoglycan/LPS O-acetylase OafA/YrhL